MFVNAFEEMLSLFTSNNWKQRICSW